MGEQVATDILEGAGFDAPEIQRVETDLLNAYYVARIP